MAQSYNGLTMFITRGWAFSEAALEEAIRTTELEQTGMKFVPVNGNKMPAVPTSGNGRYWFDGEDFCFRLAFDGKTAPARAVEPVVEELEKVRMMGGGIKEMWEAVRLSPTAPLPKILEGMAGFGTSELQSIAAEMIVAERHDERTGSVMVCIKPLSRKGAFLVLVSSSYMPLLDSVEGALFGRNGLFPTDGVVATRKIPPISGLDRAGVKPLLRIISERVMGTAGNDPDHRARIVSSTWVDRRASAGRLTAQGEEVLDNLGFLFDEDDWYVSRCKIRIDHGAPLTLTYSIDSGIGQWTLGGDNEKELTYTATGYMEAIWSFAATLEAIDLGVTLTSTKEADNIEREWAIA